MLAEKILAGNKWALARLLTRIENKHSKVQAELNQLYPHTGQAHLIGLTGAPGTGKSSLVNELAKGFRQRGKKVAILAVDPTSPFSGGAVLGDRIRMQDLAGDPNVFIRSMATRGNLGGLSSATSDALKALDAAGYEIILIETVGAGQSEVDIVKMAHTVIVVEASGLGDDVQAIKAGILEIADIFIVNKADRQGAERTVSSLKRMLELGHPMAHEVLHHGLRMKVEVPADTPPDDTTPMWRIPIVKTTAIKSQGIDEAIEQIQGHHQHLHETGELSQRNRTRLTNELQTILQDELMTRLLAQLPADYVNSYLARITARELSPYQVAQEILGE